jgi:phage-related tail fiber protein
MELWLIMNFYTLVTNTGKGRIISSHANDTSLHLTTFAVGDGGDGYYEPDIYQDSLMNETYRGSISKIYVDSDYDNRLIIECAIPSNSGGYYIREVGIFDSDKNLFAVGIIPESYKPVEEEGSTRDFYIKVVLEVDNLEDKELIIDSNVSLISFEYLENNHNQDPNAHYRLIDADKVDGFNAGNSANEIPVSNGNKNESLNADLLDGYHAGNDKNNVLVLNDKGLVPEDNLLAYAHKEHTHSISEIVTNESIHTFDNMQILSGYNTGTTTYVYPPDNYTMSDLLAFLPSIRTIHFSGDVDYNDSLYCYWEKEESRIKITCYNTEQRANPQVNWIAIWRKNRPENY